MNERLLGVWKLQEGFEIMDNDKELYIVMFDQATNKENSS